MPLSIKNTELNSFTSRINNPGRVNLNSQWNRFRMRHSIQDHLKELFSRQWRNSGTREIPCREEQF